MHVTHVVAHPPFREGTGTVCYYNAVTLRQLGCDVTVYAPRLDLNPEHERLDFYRFMPCWLALGNAYLTPRLLSIDHTDLVHLHLPFVFGSELVLARVLSSRLRMVVTYHSDLLSTNAIRRVLFPFYSRLLMPLVLKRAQRIVVTSIDYALSSFFGNSLFEKREKDLVEVPNGVDVGFFRPGTDTSAIVSRHGLGTEDAVLLFVSSLDPSHARKGLALLLETLSQVRRLSLKLIVIGEGAMRSTYERLATQLGLVGSVIFVGRVPQHEIAAYYSASDMVVIPSQPPEAFGVALAQGMAAGKPVIGSNIPGVRTVIKDGETGFLIEPGDKVDLLRRIEQLAMDPDLRNRMGQSGRQRVTRKYTWRQAGECLMNMYEHLLAEAS